MVDSSCVPSIEPKVIAVVVSYHPDLDRLKTLLAILVSQVAGTVVVDNGSTEDLPTYLNSGNAEIMMLGENLGIAVAQNRGIQRARAWGADAVLLLDQDSEPAPDMVRKLTMALGRLQAKGIQVAAVGPRYADQRRGDETHPFVRRRGLFIGRRRCRQADELIPVDFLISSGSLIPMTTLDRVGLMEEGLFIDYVDTEWVIRAAQLGYRSFGVCAAHMMHSLGDAVKSVGVMSLTLRSPLRHYYMFRNAIWLYRRAWVPMIWKLADGLRLAQRFVAYALFAKPHIRQILMMLRGMSDGWHDRMGRLQER